MLFNHFKTLNADVHNESDYMNVLSYQLKDMVYVPNDVVDVNNSQSVDILDCAITEGEIMSCINDLKCNKACGLDKVRNEYIKASAHVMLPIYCKLFNLVLDHGVFPRAWSDGYIRPIFKKKRGPS